MNRSNLHQTFGFGGKPIPQSLHVPQARFAQPGYTAHPLMQMGHIAMPMVYNHDPMRPSQFSAVMRVLNRGR